MVNRYACVLVLCHSKHSKNISCLDAQVNDRHHQSIPDSFRQSPSNSQTLFNHSAVRSHHAQLETVPDTICQLSFATAFLSMLFVLGWTLSFALSPGTTVKAAPFVMPKFLRGLALFQKALCHTKNHKVSESMKEQITPPLTHSMGSKGKQSHRKVWAQQWISSLPGGKSGFPLLFKSRS